jgi:hypothetical protein
MTRSIASSVHRLADTYVLIAVATTPRGPEPLCTRVGDEVVAVAYTDQAEAEADRPDTHKLFSIQVADLLGQLPPGVGALIDPRSPSPIHVSAASKAAVIDAGKPFPFGSSIAIGDPAREPKKLVAALREGARQFTTLRRLWRAWYQVEDAEPKLLVVYDDETDLNDAVSDWVVSTWQQVGYAHPILVLALGDVNGAHRDWLLEHISPFYERPV